MTDFSLPPGLVSFLHELDAFIEAQIRPLERRDDNMRFFDHRREWARTDWERGGLPHEDWEALLREAKNIADRAGYYRFALPRRYGGQEGSHFWMAVLREHLAAKGLGLHNDLQNEHSIIANLPFALMFEAFGTSEQQDEFIPGMVTGKRRVSFGLTEAAHGSDATHMGTRAVRERRDGVQGWRIDGEKMWATGMHNATHLACFARTSGNDGSAKGITCFLIPAAYPGLQIAEYLWTFNMPTDHPRITLTDVWVPETMVYGPFDDGLKLVQSFVHQNRIRQAAASLGAADYCVRESIAYARDRLLFGKSLAVNQAIQFPLVELNTQVQMLRLLIRETAWQMDALPHKEIELRLSDRISMCNYWANRLACEAADRAIQVHGAIGYSRHKPFEHIYRHHRRYRITEGSEEIQMRKIAGFMFGFTGPERAST